MAAETSSFSRNRERETEKEDCWWQGKFTGGTAKQVGIREATRQKKRKKERNSTKLHNYFSSLSMQQNALGIEFLIFFMGA